jgi:hypothetical protein
MNMEGAYYLTHALRQQDCCQVKLRIRNTWHMRACISILGAALVTTYRSAEQQLSGSATAYPFAFEHPIHLQR